MNTYPREFEDIVVYYSNPGWYPSTRTGDSVVIRNVNVLTYADDFDPDAGQKIINIVATIN